MNSILHLGFPQVTRLWGDYQARFLLAATFLTFLILPQALRAQGVYVQTNLVSDGFVPAQTIDANLENPWGLVQSSTSPFWVSDNGANVSTLYAGKGAKLGLTVTIPTLSTPSNGPTGIVFNGGTGFPSPAGSTTNSLFIFANLNGTIDSWAGANGMTVQVGATVPNAVFTGLAINTSSVDIYAANFGPTGGIDEFSSNWSPVSLSGNAFKDPSLASGLEPYNIQDINGTLYVAYASIGSNGKLQLALGDGALATFDESGNLLKTLVQGGNLDAPWGVAIAPADFGQFSNDLLVGNRGNGVINAFDPTSGAFLGTLEDISGNDITNSGLWALFFGTGGSGTSQDTLYITAGLNGYRDGVLAAIDPTPEPGSLILLGIGLLMLGTILRRRATGVKLGLGRASVNKS
ncbi:MAG TPA: TIGR03118 family protein [Terriglobia bacterium]|nr:TIGR03118 family protein [Terriglobia bacterium]